MNVYDQSCYARSTAINKEMKVVGTKIFLADISPACHHCIVVTRLVVNKFVPSYCPCSFDNAHIIVSYSHRSLQDSACKY